MPYSSAESDLITQDPDERPQPQQKPVLGSWASKVWSIKGVPQEERDFVGKAAAAAGETIGHWLIQAAHWRVFQERQEALKAFEQPGLKVEIMQDDQQRPEPAGADAGPTPEILVKMLELLIPLSNTKGCRTTASQVRRVVGRGMAQWYPEESWSQAGPKRLGGPKPAAAALTKFGVQPPSPAEAALIAEKLPALPRVPPPEKGSTDAED